MRIGCVEQHMMLMVELSWNSKLKFEMEQILAKYESWRFCYLAMFRGLDFLTFVLTLCHGPKQNY